MTRRVEITLGPDGTIDVDAIGFEGQTCEEATKFLDELFGEAENKTLKEEYHIGEVAGTRLPSGYCG